MSKLKEIAGYNREKKQVMKYINLHQLSVPPLDQLYEIALVDHNGKPYVFRVLKPEPASDTLEDYACESISIDLSDIKDIFIKLTDDQRNIVMHVYYLYKNRSNQNNSDEIDEENPKIILQGPAGTGKSTIISFIEKLITWEENKTSDSPQNLKVIKCAFTGKAASNIEGLTLNHTFSIPIYNTRSLSKKRLETKKEVLKDCVFFICDEISMVGERTMSVVNSRLQQIFNNDKLYGDRFVLLVGDLYQIDPVRQRPVYPKSKFWTCCEFYELTKIIRQQDEKFIGALNNFRDSKMTERDIKLFRSREIQEYNQVPDSVIHIFYLNKRVDEYNTLKLNKSNEKEEVVNAIEDCDSWDPSKLRVKIGIRYMITYNIDVGDGLANGTTGIVRDFDYDKYGFVSAVWMEFHSDMIGKKTRSDYLKKHDKPGSKNWVPLPRSKIVVKLKTDPKVNKTVGNMFPLKAAEAITVHKSQGQTYHDGACIHITQDSYDKLRTDKSLQYVALTRVTCVEDLYIMGTLDFHDVNSAKFQRTQQEINRLRNEKKLKLAFETFEDNTGDVIIYLNTGGTFYDHYQFITADKWYENASLLIFSETNIISSDQIDIPNFEIAFRSDDETALRSGGGMICYKKRNTSLKVVSSMLDDGNEMYLTLLLFQKCVYIVTGVKGDLSDDDFTCAIKKFISKYVLEEKCIFLIGDLNRRMTPHLNYVFSNLKIKKDFSCDITSTSGDNQCDVVFTRKFHIDPDLIGFYQYIPSSHKPIYVKLPPKSELLKRQRESQYWETESQSLDSKSQYVDSSESQSVVSNGPESVSSNESQSLHSDYQSVNRKSRSEDSESQSKNSESQSLCSESEFVSSEPRSVYGESESMKSESHSMDSESQSVHSKSSSADSESQSVHSKSSSADSESQSVISNGPESMGSNESQSVHCDYQSVNGKSRSEDSESESKNSESQSLYSEFEFANSQSRSVDRESESLGSESQSMNRKSIFVGSESHSMDQSVHSETQSVYSDSQSVYSKSQSGKSESQSICSGSQSLCSESQHMDSEISNSQTLSELMEMD